MDEPELIFGLNDEHKHNRVIIHIDIDCFYAQVEEIRNPLLRTKPVGIQQKNIVVTCNYVARSFGIKKLMLLTDAQRLCPDLVLVNGEDLTPYRQMSNKIHSILLTYTPLVEKLGLDENFIDVTNIVEHQLNENNSNCDLDVQMNENPLIDYNVYPENETLSTCNCGCEKRLLIGIKLAYEMRRKLFTELKITSCAGIAHNKLMAKIIGTKNKPNKQTVLIPACTNNVMIELESIRSIPGIGQKAEQTLNEAGVCTIKQLQDVDFSVLQKLFGYETSIKYKDWSFGIDKKGVTPSGKPKSISLEDSCKSISFRADVEDKFRLLLIRLVNQVAEDGRIPLVIKIIVRKYNSERKSSHRETKQANILPSLFKEGGNGKLMLVDNGQEKLLKIVMRLFDRVVNLKLPFNITLLGLAFSKFQERNRTRHSVANFLIRTTDMEVQSITSLSSDGIQSIKNYQMRGSPTQMDFDTISEASHASHSSDISESEIEPSPKKNKFCLSLAKRRCLEAAADTASPSKLRVAELRLNSKEFDSDDSNWFNQSSSNQSNSHDKLTSNENMPMLCDNNLNAGQSASVRKSSQLEQTDSNFPPIVDPNVFKELPFDVQQELLNQWRTQQQQKQQQQQQPQQQQQQQQLPTSESHASVVVKTISSGKTSKTNTLHRYFITNN